MVVSVALARRIDDTSGAHCKCRECKLSAVNAWGFSKCEIEPCDIPMSLPLPGGVSSLDLDRRRKPRGPFSRRRIWTADAWSGRTQAHQPSVPDADPFTPNGQEGRHDYRTEKETDQSE